MREAARAPRGKLTSLGLPGQNRSALHDLETFETTARPSKVESASARSDRRSARRPTFAGHPIRIFRGVPSSRHRATGDGLHGARCRGADRNDRRSRRLESKHRSRAVGTATAGLEKRLGEPPTLRTVSGCAPDAGDLQPSRPANMHGSVTMSTHSCSKTWAPTTGRMSPAPG
jgi:hypothetical protein